jgi:hypothetical protein
MRVRWFGQSAFWLADGGTSVALDPFGSMEELSARGLRFAYPPIRDVAADLVLITHEHVDHNAATVIRGAPRVIRSTAGRSTDARWRGVPDCPRPGRARRVTVRSARWTSGGMSGGRWRRVNRGSPGGSQRELSGKVAIVTGGGRGLGRAMTLGLAAAGARVVVTAARHGEEIARLAEEAQWIPGTGAVLPVTADVTREDGCERVVGTALAECGGLHILGNNAGRGMRFVSETFMEVPTKCWEVDAGTWRLIIETNVNGPFLMAKAAVPHFLT